MAKQLVAWRNRLLGTLWFVPGLIVVASIAAALGMVELSAVVDDEALLRWPRFFGASADSSRSILATIAGGMITVAGLTFSLTMVAVTQASSQFSPRVLRNFMNDRTSQWALGTFVAVFAYCLIVLRTIRSVDERRFVPSLAVVFGILLAIVGTGVLIHFVHHIASSLQASTIIARVARETVAAIDTLFPEHLGEEALPDERRDAASAASAHAWHPVPASTTGYVQSVDEERLLQVANADRHLVRMECGVGDFVVEGLPIASIAMVGSSPDRTSEHDAGGGLDGAVRRLAAAFTIGTHRTVEQDVAFGVRQLVDVALRALSPGINDTTTAISCIDYLGAILVRLANRRIESPVRTCDGEVRLLARGPEFGALLRLAGDEIRRSAGGNVRILQRLLEIVAQAAAITRDPSRRALLAEQGALVMTMARRTVEGPEDLAVLLECQASAGKRWAGPDTPAHIAR